MEFSSSTHYSVYYIITMIIGCLSCVPYLILCIVYFKRKTKFDIIAIINLQLIISCLLDSISFIIPNQSNETVTVQCKIQIIFSIFSEISMYAISFFIALISLLNFSYKDGLERNKLFVYIIICIFCWVIPILCGIIPPILNQINNKNGICYVDEKLTNEVYVVFGFIIILHTINFITLLLLRKKIKDYLKGENLGILYHKYYKRLLRYLILLGLSFFSMVYSLIVLSLFHKKIIGETGLNIFTFISNFIEATLCPCYAIVYGFNMEDWRDLKKTFSCDKKAPIEVPKTIGSLNESLNLSEYDSLGYS